MRACRSPLGFLMSDWRDGLVTPISEIGRRMAT